MKTKSFKVEKLIRNQVPSILRAKGIVVPGLKLKKECWKNKLAFSFLTHMPILEKLFETSV